MSRLITLNGSYLTSPKDDNAICAIGCKGQEELRCGLCIWGYPGDNWEISTICDQVEARLDTPQVIHNITESLSYVPLNLSTRNQ